MCPLIHDNAWCLKAGVCRPHKEIPSRETHKMALATLFPMSVYIMLALSSFVLMYAEGTPFPAVMTLPISLIAYLYSERKSIIVLSGWMANFMGLLALGFAAQEFFSDNLEGRLLSGAHLLVYLSWLVIFLTKTRQHYWWA